MSIFVWTFRDVMDAIGAFVALIILAAVFIGGMRGKK